MHSGDQQSLLQPSARLATESYLAMVQNQWYPILGQVNSPPILEPILVVGLGCSKGVRGFDPWPFDHWRTNYKSPQRSSPTEP